MVDENHPDSKAAFNSVRAHEKDPNLWLKNFIRDACHTYGEEHAARVLVRSTFSGKTDRGGQPYFEHLQRVADGVEGRQVKAIAFLHDLIEDIPGWDYDDLKYMGFSDYVIDGVRAVTKHDEDPYFDEMVRVGLTPQAIAVKRSDLRDNSNLLRLCGIPTEKDFERTRKYFLAYHYLGAVESGAIKPGTPFATWMKAQKPEMQDEALLRKYSAAYSAGCADVSAPRGPSAP